LANGTATITANTAASLVQIAYAPKTQMAGFG
jgi:hypothetical protein